MKITKEMVDELLNSNELPIDKLKNISSQETISLLLDKKSEFDEDVYQYLQEKAEKYCLNEGTPDENIKSYVLGYVMANIFMFNNLN